MKETLKRLWHEYLLEECSTINTDEERRLTKKALELHDKANALLDKDQQKAVEDYFDALCDVDAVFARKAFICGCSFAVSFLLEAAGSEK